MIHYFHTLRYLKPVQIRYRIFYILRRYWRKISGFQYPPELVCPQVIPLHFEPSITSRPAWTPRENRFRFLNLEQHFPKGTDWNFGGHGKLWTYNLHYFEYLLQADVKPEDGLALLRDFTRQLPQVAGAREPYPIALRLIFGIRFLSRHRLEAPDLDCSFYAQAYMLADQLEYHLLGNHLLENGFGLLFAAYRYQDDVLYQKAKNILSAELREQVLTDGGHFERSPMYHQIVMYRVLDSINLVSHNNLFDKELEPMLREKAALLLNWLQQMTFSNGDIPLFNDAAFGVAPDTGSLASYAELLNISPTQSPLSDSGYRRFKTDNYDLIADVGEIGPDYIPGHAHSDTLSFILYAHALPFIVDTGISTYEKNERRQYERSTIAHNTIQIDGKDQTEIWGGFRVARRAKPIILRDEPTLLEATHTGYDGIGCRHTRTFVVEPAFLKMIDKVTGGQKGRAFLHFHPNVKLQKKEDYWAGDGFEIRVDGCQLADLQEGYYAPEFNRREKNQCLVFSFTGTLETTIVFTS